ncbi:MAG: hypothetical protein JXL97_03190 [Bacteroidales bacterium]|nr:hypothetical protein [Bacteroidales bacterium]
MKNLLVILGLFLIVSCGSNDANDASVTDDQNSTTTQQNNNTTNNNAVVNDDNDNNGDVNANNNAATTFNPDDCQQFLDDYEAWADEAIVVVKSAKANPADPQNIEKLLLVTEELTNWSTKWNAIYGCSDDPDFNARIDEIEQKIDTELNQ